ncbi:hypothetical protein [Stenotrophomonas rhizophila]
MALATRRHDNGRLDLSMYPTTMPNASLRLPSAIVAFAFLLACALATASPPGATAAATFQRDLVAILECRADPATTQRIGSTLRAAMYGDAQQRPAHLRDWRFERGGDEDHPFTTIDMPAPLKAQGITTRRVFVDDLGMSMPIDGAQRERIVATHALRLRSSTLHEPFSVWSRPVAAGEKPLPAAVVVRSDGDGYRLGCDRSGEQGEDVASARRPRVADAHDLAAAAECRASPEALERVEAFWNLALEASQYTWPAQLQGIASRDSDELYVATLFEPIEVHGVPTRKVALGMGLLAAVIEPGTTERAVQAAGMTAADRAEPGLWEKDLHSDDRAGSRVVRSVVVLQRDGVDTLAGCMYGRRVTIDD